jgi:cytochrome P450
VTTQNYAGVDFDPWDPRVADDPYPTFSILRRDAPVHFIPNRGYWTVARFEDVRACMRDTDTFSSNLMYGNSPVLAPSVEELEASWEPQPTYPVPPARAPHRPADRNFNDLMPAVFEVDPPDHGRVRRLLVRPLKPDNMSALEDEIRTTCEELFDELVSQVRADGLALFRSSYARPLSLRVASKLMGIPQEDAAYLGHLAEATLAYFALEPAHRREFEPAYPELCGYFARHLDEHEYDAEKLDKISILNPLREPDEEGDDRLTPTELLSNAAALFRGGFETTVNLMGNAMVALLQNPEQLEAVTSDPSLLDVAMEETMRYDGPVVGVFRVATRSTEVAGQAIPKGALVHLLFASANRDETHFDSPDEFKLDRWDASDQVSFGYGRHYCLGAGLARMESRIAFETLLSRIKDLRLPGPAPVYRHTVIRGRTEVPITFNVA